MNPKVSELPFDQIAKDNIHRLTFVENEIFGYKLGNGSIIPLQRKYWDISEDGTTQGFLRCE